MDKENNYDIHKELLHLVKIERRITSKILELLQNLESQKVYLNWGYANLFDYLVRGLGYSEALAYQRRAAVKVCTEIPEIKSKIDCGSLSLTTIARANKTLNCKTTEEKRVLFEELENKTSREVDKILAREINYAAIKSTQGFAGPAKRCATKSGESHYIAEHTVRVTLDFSEEDFRKLERLKALKSHKIKSLQELFLFLAENELEKFNRTSKTPSRSEKPRQIKISLKNHLLQKAEYKCQYLGCEQTHFLQIDHITSVHNGGANHPANLQVLCQAHNLLKFTHEQKRTGYLPNECSPMSGWVVNLNPSGCSDY